MKADFKLHVQEIIRFLELVVIKFDYFETYFDTSSKYKHLSVAYNHPHKDYNDDGEQVETVIDLLNVDGSKNSSASEYHTKLIYYRILSGDESLLQNKVMVFDPSYINDEDKYKPLSKTLLANHTSIRPYYFGVDNKYLLLKAQYPEDWELIKRIFFPIDAEEALAADTMDVLYHPSTFVRDNERTDLVDFTQDIAKTFEYRWYIRSWNSEDLYPLAFWAILWGFLPSLLLMRRIENLHTAKAHSFYVWEFLQSHGIPNLRTKVTYPQEQYLYKNIRFLEKNFGKHFLLEEFERVFLRPRRCFFAGKRLMNITEGREAFNDRIPEVIDTRNGIPNYNDSVNLPSFLHQIDMTGLADSDDTVDKFEEKIGFSRRTEYQTKFIEIKAGGSNIDTRMIYNVVFDTFMCLYCESQLQYTILINDARYGSDIETLSIHDCILMIAYLVNWDDTVLDEDKPIPTRYQICNAITNRSGNVEDRFVDESRAVVDNGIVKPFGLDDPDTNNTVYISRISSYIDLDDIVGDIPEYTERIITSSNEVTEVIQKDLDWFTDKKAYLLNLHSTSAYKATLAALNAVVQGSPEHREPVLDNGGVHQTDPETGELLYYTHKYVTLPTTYSNYGEFFNAREELRLLILEQRNTDEREELLASLFNTLLPVKFTEQTDTRSIIEAIKEIFQCLTSYNVTFLSSIISEQITLTNHTLAQNVVVEEDSWIGKTEPIAGNVYSVAIDETSDETHFTQGGLDAEIDEASDMSDLVFPDMGDKLVATETDEEKIYAFNQGNDLQLLDDLL